MAVGLGPEEDDRAALVELADAMLVWAEGPEVERIDGRGSNGSGLSSWHAEIRDGLLRVAAHEEKTGARPQGTRWWSSTGLR